MKERRQKVEIGAKEPQMVVERRYPDGELSYSSSVAGNDMCRKCGNCCKGGRSAWMEYYYDNQKDLKKAMALARKHPWFDEMWNATAKIRDKYRYRYSGGGKKSRWCAMLENRKGLFSCKIHRLLGFNAKPAVCKNHSCDKLRAVLQKQKEEEK